MNSGKLDTFLSQVVAVMQGDSVFFFQKHLMYKVRNSFGNLFVFHFSLQGKEYVFVANSDNLGAIVDLSILIMVSNELSFLVVSHTHTNTWISSFFLAVLVLDRLL